MPIQKLRKWAINSRKKYLKITKCSNIYSLIGHLILSYRVQLTLLFIYLVYIKCAILIYLLILLQNNNSIHIRFVLYLDILYFNFSDMHMFIYSALCGDTGRNIPKVVCQKPFPAQNSSFLSIAGLFSVNIDRRKRRLIFI